MQSKSSVTVPTHAENNGSLDAIDIDDFVNEFENITDEHEPEIHTNVSTEWIENAEIAISRYRLKLIIHIWHWQIDARFGYINDAHHARWRIQWPQQPQWWQR